jgi:signal transduction histidine kinase
MDTLRNIVENALRYTPEGTTVSIVVANPPAISVIDRGPGVSPDQRNAIFRRFWQGDRGANKGGVGLGMDIAARTVVAHGGTMSVEDAPDGGAMFTMHFEPLSVLEAHLPSRSDLTDPSGL